MAGPRWAACMEAYRLHLQGIGRSHHTVDCQFSVLARFTLFCAHHDCTPLLPPDRIIDTWLASLYPTYSRNTIRDYFLALRTFYRWAVAAGFTRLNPLDGLPTPHERIQPIKPYTLGELRRFIAAAPDLRQKTIVLLLLGSGMRANELVHLRVEDIDWPAESLLIVEGKGHKSRYVSPGQLALTTLREYLYNQSIRSGFVFRGLGKEPMLASSLYHLIQRLGEQAKVPNANVHRFRNTFACRYLDLSNGDVASLKTILGHSNMTMSLRYAAYFEGERALASQRRFNPADRLSRLAVLCGLSVGFGSLWPFVGDLSAVV